MELSDKDRRVLLLAARSSIKSVIEKTVQPQIDYLQYPCLKQPLGAFVTLKIDKDLRGCIGYIFTKTTLFETVCEAAKQAAFSDPRFLPLNDEELIKIKIEISVISPLLKIKDYNEIIIGKHGLVLDDNFFRAVLLPQVAISNNFGREQFISALCEKAGLFPETWKIKKLNLQIFTAEVFSEEEML